MKQDEYANNVDSIFQHNCSCIKQLCIV